MRIWIGQRLSDGLLFSLVLNDIKSFFTCEQLVGNKLPSNCYSLNERGILPENRSKWTYADIRKIVDVYAQQLNVFLDEGFVLLPYYMPIESMPSLHIKQKVFNEKVFRCQLVRSLQMFMMEQYNVITPKWVIPQQLSWEEISNFIGSPFILQFDNTSSGLGTYLINSKSDYLFFIDRYGEADIATQYIPDSYSCSTHIWISSDSIQLASPSMQLIERQLLTTDTEIQTFSFHGNDFGLYNSEIGKSIHIEEQLLKIGYLYQKAGIWGLVGIDYMVKDGNFFYNETNFRLQNSTSLLSFLQPKKNNIARLMLHRDRKLAEVSSGFQYFITLKAPQLLSGIYSYTGKFVSDFNSSNLLNGFDKYLVFVSDTSNQLQNIRIIGMGKGYDKYGHIDTNLSKFIERLENLYG